MIQRTMRSIPGYFQTCRTCGREPRHILCSGRTNNEPPRAFGEPAERHMIECSCGRTSGRFASLTEAERDWGDKWAQTELHLPRARQPRRAAA